MTLPSGGQGSARPTSPRPASHVARPTKRRVGGGAAVAGRPPYRWLIVAVVIVAVAVVGVWWVASRRGAEPQREDGAKREERPTKRRVEGNAPYQRSRETRDPTEPEERVAAADTNAPAATAETWLGTPVVRHDVVTNDTLIVETFYTSDGKKHKYYHDEREKALPSGADQILAMMTANNGYGAPPLPSVSNFESDFGDALKNEIVIDEGDSKEVREVKERVIAARKELLELMAEGRSANDVLREWQTMQEDNATVRLDAVSKVRELLAEGDDEGARELCEQYNAVLERAGIMPIELPKKKTRRPAHEK